MTMDLIQLDAQGIAQLKDNLKNADVTNKNQALKGIFLASIINSEAGKAYIKKCKDHLDSCADCDTHESDGLKVKKVVQTTITYKPNKGLQQAEKAVAKLKEELKKAEIALKAQQALAESTKEEKGHYWKIA